MSKGNKLSKNMKLHIDYRISNRMQNIMGTMKEEIKNVIAEQFNREKDLAERERHLIAQEKSLRKREREADVLYKRAVSLKQQATERFHLYEELIESKRKKSRVTQKDSSSSSSSSCEASSEEILGGGNLT